SASASGGADAEKPRVEAAASRTVASRHATRINGSSGAGARARGMLHADVDRSEFAARSARAREASFERCPIPAQEIRGCVVRALQEGEEHLVRTRGRSH